MYLKLRHCYYNAKVRASSEKWPLALYNSHTEMITENPHLCIFIRYVDYIHHFAQLNNELYVLRLQAGRTIRHNKPYIFGRTDTYTFCISDVCTRL